MTGGSSYRRALTLSPLSRRRARALRALYAKASALDAERISAEIVKE